MGREEEEEEEEEEEKEAEGLGFGLVVGNYCHDVLFREGSVVGESLGGAASFVSNVLDALSPLPSHYVSKVGSDFAYTVAHPPLIPTATSSPTTLFHAYFGSDAGGGGGRGDRILKRVRSCDPIFPSDLPTVTVPLFEFGLAVAVAGEIPPETLARMVDLCRVVLVDVQGLIRTFDPVDGTVGLVPLNTTGFFHLLPRIGFLKASAEEAPFLDLDEIRKRCCVIVTDGKDGCRVYWKEVEVRVPPFPALQVDPTGAGDSFLGGFVVGLISGLTVPDAALLGNFFGSLTVGQIGIPKFDPRMLQNVKREVERMTMQCVGSCWRNVAVEFRESDVHEKFHASLIEAAKLSSSCIHFSTEPDNEQDSKHR